MSEIERAIEILERDDTGVYEIFEKPSYVDLLLNLCRAELEREKNPMTCDGCKQQGAWDDELEYGYNCPCFGCKRNCIERYEPKGEPNV